jgi:hypothetical protein
MTKVYANGREIHRDPVEALPYYGCVRPINCQNF